MQASVDSARARTHMGRIYEIAAGGLWVPPISPQPSMPSIHPRRRIADDSTARGPVSTEPAEGLAYTGTGRGRGSVFLSQSCLSGWVRGGGDAGSIIIVTFPLSEADPWMLPWDPG